MGATGKEPLARASEACPRFAIAQSSSRRRKKKIQAGKLVCSNLVDDKDAIDDFCMMSPRFAFNCRSPVAFLEECNLR